MSRRHTTRCRYTVRGSTSLVILAAIALLSLQLLVGFSLSWSDARREELLRAEVIQGRMPVTITASGKLQCQTSTRIRCGVFELGDKGGTQILAIVPDGSEVKQGDLLFEIDSARVQERLDLYKLRRINYRARYIEASTKLTNQRLRNKTRLQEARQALEIARLALEAYDETSHDIARAELTMAINDAKSELQLARAELAVRRRERIGMGRLHQQGYRGAADLREAELKELKALNVVQSGERKVENALAKLDSFDTLEHPLQRRKLVADLKTAQSNLRQTKVDNQTQLQERIGVKKERERVLAHYDEQIQRYTDQVNNCTVYAPHDGFVVYDDDRDRYGNSIGPGSFIRWQETIMHLPDLSRMQVQATVSEAEYRHLEPGLKCSLTVTAFPDKTFSGTVHSVSPLPQPVSRYVDDVHVFEVLINLEESADLLRPGMTSVATIDVLYDEPVVQVPIEAVFAKEQELFAVVDTPAGLRRQPIKIGDCNREMVEVREGLRSGELVVLQEDTTGLDELPVLAEPEHSVR